MKDIIDWLSGNRAEICRTHRQYRLLYRLHTKQSMISNEHPDDTKWHALIILLSHKIWLVYIKYSNIVCGVIHVIIRGYCCHLWITILSFEASSHRFLQFRSSPVIFYQLTWFPLPKVRKIWFSYIRNVYKDLGEYIPKSKSDFTDDLSTAA